MIFSAETISHLSDHQKMNQLFWKKEFINQEKNNSIFL